MLLFGYGGHQNRRRKSDGFRESVAWTLASLIATAVALGADFGREHKVFTVRKRTGEVL
jgi:hypothetical protein